MAEMLLINPRRRRRAAKASARRASPKRRRTTARRRRNPVAVTPAVTRSVRRIVRRRANPIAGRRRVSRRRRNPIGIGRISASSILNQFKDAAIGGAGAIAMDLAMGKINQFLPASLQTSSTSVGVGDAVKGVITVLAGKLLSKPTKGLSVKMAQGALTCQARDILSSFLPATMAMGYATPARTMALSTRVGPNRLNAYTRPGATPLLSAYTKPGSVSPLLNGRGNIAAREGFKFR